MTAHAKNEVLAPEPTAIAPATILGVIAGAAKDPNVDIDKLERLMAMHERMVSREAETAWNDAMAACQKELRAIAADAYNPQTKSRYATYAKLDGVLRPIYSKHGFAISYDTDTSSEAEHIRVLALVSRGAFTRIYKVDMPKDGKGAKGGDVMTKTHATGAGMQYGMRYLLKAIFNVAIGDEDTDGNGPPGMSESEIAEWVTKIESTTTKEAAKAVWQEAMKIAQAAKDRYAAKTLKDRLIAHGEFIDKAAKAQ